MRGRFTKAVALHAHARATNETPEVLNSGIETTLIGCTKHFGGGMQNIGSRKMLFHLGLRQTRREFDNSSGADAALNIIARHSWN
jgi:hypothetical protein